MAQNDFEKMIFQYIGNSADRFFSQGYGIG